MPRSAPLQENFSSGEISPLLYGRVSFDRYKAGMKKCLNSIPVVQGGCTRRTGTYYVSDVKTSSKATRVVSFEYSTTQAYIIEFGDQYIRFYRNQANITLTGQNITAITKANPAVVTYAGSDTYANGDRFIISGVSGMIEVNNREFEVANVNAGANTFELSGVNSSSYTTYTSGGLVSEIYQITTPYLEAHLFQLNFTQSADTLYIAHPSYAPRKLTRSAHTTWTLTAIDFLDGPYLPLNTTAITLTPGATSGSTSLTASSALFVSTDVGRLVRLLSGSTQTWAQITAYTSATVVTMLIRGQNLPGLTAMTAWRLGLWSDTTGYPSVVTFHENRLTYANSAALPQRFDMSVSDDYENFAPTNVVTTTSTVLDSSAISFSLASTKVNAVRWLSSDEKGLAAGTVGGEWIIRPSDQGEALSPSNVSGKKVTSHGSANVAPVQAGKATLYVQRSARKIREMTFFQDADGFRSPDLTILSEHIAESGIKEIAYQQDPYSVVWCVRNDGVLLGLTYERDLENIKAGWSRHILGGESDAAGSDAIVESVATIPSSDEARVETWLVVKRYINGASKRYIEFISQEFTDELDQQDAFFVDAGLTYDSPVTVSGATKANPVVVTANSHGFSNGDKVLFNEVLGMTNLNGNTYLVANKAANTFELTDLAGVNINGTAFSTYVSGGEVRKLVTTIAGLFHLEGQSVDILGDGAVQPSKTVSNGSITLATSAAVVNVGLGYFTDGQLPRIEAGSADGTALGKTRRVNRVAFLLHRSLGLKIGPDFNNLTTIPFRTASDPMGRAPSLFSGIKSETIAMGYDFENEICWRQDQPLPLTVLAIAPQMVTQDRG